MQGRLPGSKVTLVALVGLALVAVPLAGCIGGGGSSTDDGPVDDEITNDTENKTPKDAWNGTIEVQNTTEFQENSTIHTHDYWGDRKHLMLINGATKTVDLSSQASEEADFYPPSVVFDIEPKPDEPHFVFPGTGKMDITLEYSGTSGGQGTVPTLNPQLCFGSPLTTSSLGSASYCQDAIYDNNYHTFTESGETWTITRDLENREGESYLGVNGTDPPHSPKSNWRFEVLPCRYIHSDGPVTPNACTADASVDFTLTVEIERGEESLPVNPPHFKYFGDDDTFHLVTWSDTGTVGQAGSVVTNPQGEDPTWVLDGALLEANDDSEETPPVVPPRTSKLQIDVNWSSQGSMTPVVKFKHASDPWSNAWRDTGCEGEGSCTIPVEDAWTDSPYAYRTQWVFAVFLEGTPRTPPTQYDIAVSLTAVT